MADLHGAINQFHRQITVRPEIRIAIRIAIESIRKQIRRHFRHTIHQPEPRFRSQGAYAINTLVNPINGEFNLNDGVYLLHLDNQEDRNWPTGATVHGWLLKALYNFGRAKIIENGTYVRVQYKGLYNVDLRVYGMLNGQVKQAVKGIDWIQCDPHALVQWFKNHVSSHGEQLLRIIRYVKAWSDFQSLNSEQMPISLLLSVLAVRHFQENARDDVALAYTFKVISKAVISYFSIPNPVDHKEELAGHLSFAQMKRFCTAIEEAAATAVRAIRGYDAREASILWQSLFGNRFPLSPM